MLSLSPDELQRPATTGRRKKETKITQSLQLKPGKRKKGGRVEEGKEGRNEEPNELPKPTNWVTLHHH